MSLSCVLTFSYLTWNVNWTLISAIHVFSEISEVYVKKLKLLGIKVLKSFGEEVTHLIWYNGSGARVAAAVVMGIFVVNTGWIDKLEECQGNFYDSEHQITNGIQPTQAVAAVFQLIDNPARSNMSQLSTAKIDSPKKIGHRGWTKSRLTGDAEVRARRRDINSTGKYLNVIPCSSWL